MIEKRALSCFAATLVVGAWLSCLYGASLQARPVSIDEPGSGASGGSDGTSTPSPTCQSVNLEGKVYYNDQRQLGRFPLRRDVLGRPGVQYGVANGDNLNNRSPHFLGLFEATVEVHEVDLARDAICLASDLQGSTTIANDGSWSWQGRVCDICGRDDVSETNTSGKVGVSVGAKVVLRHCPDSTGQCYSVQDPGPFLSTQPSFSQHGSGATSYALWHPKANEVQPQRVYDGRMVTLPAQFFQKRAADVTDIHSHAAMTFASLVDVTRTMHRKYNVPFNRHPYGEVRVIFPMNWPDGGLGHSHQPSHFCVPAPRLPGQTGEGQDNTVMVPNDWPREKLDDTVAHEYGHILMYRAWDGVGKYTNIMFDIDGDGKSSGSEDGNYDSLEHYATATKEAWAAFVARVTFNGVTEGRNGTPKETLTPRGCDRSRDYDDDVSGATAICAPPSACKRGHRSPDAVEHALCDWFDNSGDRGDLFKGDTSDSMSGEKFREIYDAMKNAWAAASPKIRDNYRKFAWEKGDLGVTRGVHLCDFAEAHVKAHPQDSAALDSTLRHNGY